MATNGEYLRPVMTWVDSEQEARISYVVPGSVGFFMEKNNPRFYIKDANTNNLRIFEFKEVTPQPAAQTPTPFVTQDEFYKALEDLKSYISESVKPRYKNYNKEKTNNG